MATSDLRTRVGRGCLRDTTLGEWDTEGRRRLWTLSGWDSQWEGWGSTDARLGLMRSADEEPRGADRREARLRRLSTLTHLLPPPASVLTESRTPLSSPSPLTCQTAWADAVALT